MSVHRQNDSFVEYTDLNGNMVAGYNYSPFRITEEIGEHSDNPFKFTGREDDGTGLYYYRARYYNPEMGRFISEDPIRFVGGMNFYAYVENNPVNYIDPEGEYAQWVVFTAAVVAGVYFLNEIFSAPDLSHEPQPHLECLPAHTDNRRTMPTRRLPRLPRERPRLPRQK